MTLYQSETLARMDYLKETLRKIGDRQLVAQKAADLSDPNFPSVHPIGLDWHSRLTQAVTGLAWTLETVRYKRSQQLPPSRH